MSEFDLLVDEIYASIQKRRWDRLLSKAFPNGNQPRGFEEIARLGKSTLADSERLLKSMRRDAAAATKEALRAKFAKINASATELAQSGEISGFQGAHLDRVLAAVGARLR